MEGGKLVKVLGIALLALLLGTAVAAGAGSFSTVTRTIQDLDRDNRLESAPGEDYVVRDDLGQALPGREDRRVERLTFAQLTDLHVVDEESPARVEFLDKLGPPLTSAYRPQEGLSPQVLNEMVREVRNAVSPVTQRQLELVMTTGDNSDNTQCNETRLFIDLLDGAASNDPTADVPGSAAPARNCVPPALLGASSQVDPNSGIEGTCEPSDGRLYDGVRDDNEYYEPDSSDEPGADNEDGPGYSPDQAENEREASRSSEVRDFPGLFEAMNRPFLPTGLDDLPWFGIFGNHDGLVQGNQPRNPGFDAVAQGCVKVTGLSTALRADFERLSDGGLTFQEAEELRDLARQDIERIAAAPDAFPGLVDIVPSDPRRALLRKSEFIEQHFLTSGAPVGHGFDAANIASGQGNYSFSPAPGLRFIVLDTVAENGGEDGNIDDAQFRWIHDELLRAEASKELVMTFAHHSIETMGQPPASPFPPGDQGGNNDPNVHYGEQMRGVPGQLPCATRDPAAPIYPTETLRCLFLRHPSVVAFVAGHEHNNRVRPFARPNDAGQPAGRALGGFWQIVTAAHIDWPQQSRLLDLVDNRDGNLSIFATILDQGAPPDPGGAPPSDGRGRATESVRRLASISRELSFNDPDASNGEDGRSDARGGREDRNVELIVRDPYAAD